MKATFTTNKDKPLEHRMTVEFAAENVSQEVTQRLGRLKNKVKLNGFRPGKIPMSIMQQQYGQEVFLEVINDRVDKAYSEGLKQLELNPVGTPDFQDLDVKDLEKASFTAVFEIYPEFTLVDHKKLKINTINTVIEDTDIDDMVEKMRSSHASWASVDRASKTGDQITMDFEGFLDDVAFEGGKAENHKMVLGEGQMIPGFEEGIVGMKPNDEKTVDVTFPEQYHAQHLAGKAVQFKFKVHSVEEKVESTLDESFIKSLGIASGLIDDLRNDIKTRLEREAKGLDYQKNRESTIDALLKENEFPIPEAMIAQETETIVKQIQERQKMANQPISEKTDLLNDEMRENVLKRVRVGLIFYSIIQQSELTIDSKLLDEMVDDQVSQYPNAEEARQYFMNNKAVRADLENAVLERQVVEKVLSEATLKAQQQSFKETTKSE